MPRHATLRNEINARRCLYTRQKTTRNRKQNAEYAKKGKITERGAVRGISCVRTRRLKPETEAREVAMAAEESGRTPGRCPTIMLEETCTAYCDRLTATMGSARYASFPVSLLQYPFASP
jgi:hypothetical protein